MFSNYPQHHVVNVNSRGDHRYDTLIAAPTHETSTTFIPQILADLGVAKSIGEVRRNRPELVEELPSVPHFQRITYGKKIIDLFVGGDTK